MEASFVLILLGTASYLVWGVLFLGLWLIYWFVLILMICLFIGFACLLVFWVGAIYYISLLIAWFLGCLGMIGGYVWFPFTDSICALEACALLTCL